MERVLKAMPQPVINVDVKSPEITVNTPPIKTGTINVDVASDGKRRGRSFEKTVTGYDEQGRILSMVEREVFDEGED
jgi:hypothetical protein